MYAVRVLQGISYTLYFVAAATLVADLAPASRLGQALGWFGSAGPARAAAAFLRVDNNYLHEIMLLCLHEK